MPKLRPLPASEVCQILSRHGFQKLRQAGSHIIMRLEDAKTGGRTVPVPNHREIAVGTLKSIITQSGLPADLFRK
jgi:predicted RNA binding protein YcfA (HicA-like mRNA interferase family)